MIKAVLFDMGGTVEEAVQNERTREACADALCECLRRQGLYPEGVSREDFAREVYAGYDAYRAWSMETTRELTPFEVWHDYCLAHWTKKEKPELDEERLRAVSDHLSFLYETVSYDRELRPDAWPALEELKKAGFRLAVISNTVTYSQVPHTLKKYGMNDIFERVLLSSQAGYRKPNPVLFHVLLGEMGLEASEACYVGDTITRDVIGAKRAGLALTFRIQSGLSKSSDKAYTGELEADYVVRALTEIPEILANYNRREGEK